MVEGIFFAHSVKDHREFLPPIAEYFTAASNLANPRRDHFQHLVTNIVPVDVIKLLEVIDIQYRQGVGVAKGMNLFIKGAALRQVGQFISISHVV